MSASSRILLLVDNWHEADAVRALPYLNAVRERHPHAHIVLLIAERAAPVFERLRPFDRVVVSRLYEQRSASLRRLRLKKVSELLRLAIQVGLGYDLVITFGGGTTLLNVLGRVVGRRSIGYANAFPRLLSSDLGRYASYGDIDQQHVALLRACGIRVGTSEVPLIYGRDDEHAVELLLSEHRLATSRALVVLHPGSDWACQQWIADRWAELAERLVADYGADVLFTGVQGESGYIRAIQSRMRAPSVSLAGRTSLAQLEALLARARLCVCVDSAAYDLAVSAETPTVVLTGPTDAKRSLLNRLSPIVVNRTPPQMKDAINSCKEPKHPYGGCLNYACPMSGLRDVSVAHVLEAVGAFRFG